MRVKEWIIDRYYWRKFRREACGIPDCHDIVCRAPEHEHRPCKSCRKPTAEKGLWIDRSTLRRRILPLCHECKYMRPTYGQDQLRVKRTRFDWEKVTVPLNGNAIDTARMEEQYPGLAREAIRAFLHSDKEFATVTSDIPAGLVQTAIENLGLDEDIYAEQRNNTTVLRKVEK